MKINMLHLQHHTGVIAVSPAPFASRDQAAAAAAVLLPPTATSRIRLGTR